jgi:hypothetical protein
LSAEPPAARFIPAPALARAVMSDAGLLPHLHGAAHHESCVLLFAREISQAERSVASSSTMAWCGVVRFGFAKNLFERIRIPAPFTACWGHAQVGRV